mgnify:CR=1 FL=1
MVPPKNAPTVRTLKSKDLEVLFQPIVSLTQPKVFGVEALARCHIRAIAKAEDLVAAAVSQGAMGRLGRALRQLAFRRQPEGRVFLNVHPTELMSRWIVRPDDPLRTFEGTAYVELPEWVVFEDMALVKAMVGDLRASGIKIVIDDVLAGATDLLALQSLEPDVVKIDQRAIHQLPAGRGKVREAVAAIVQMAKSYGAMVIAEGVETRDQALHARDLGCDYGQGELFARPSHPVPDVSWSHLG